MSPVDAIRPPRKKTGKPAPSSRTAKRPIRQPLETPTAKPTPTHHHSRAREQLVWIIAVSITGLVLIGWLVLYSAGATGSGESNSLFGKIGNTISDIWDTARTDWLHLKSTLDEQSNQNVNDEQIQQLEEQVFPQFEDPSNQ